MIGMQRENKIGDKDGITMDRSSVLSSNEETYSCKRKPGCRSA